MSELLQSKSDEYLRAHRLAELLLKDCEQKESSACPLKEFLEKSFAERILYLEDQSRADLELMLKRCESCGKCNK